MHAFKLSSCLWLGAAMAASLPSLSAFADAPRQLTLEQRGDPGEWLLAHRRGFLTHPTQSTGYWARKGEALSVNIAYQGTPPNLPRSCGWCLSPTPTAPCRPIRWSSCAPASIRSPRRTTA
ncbi:hypothetical protein [Chromobacterium sp. Beijing]|uniref:hypothetical protein n=1 Tax=Chromobacterium sp. Beijing TaxID=2735795 RepID=UPI001F2D2A03|nr:hypothetical protein [Chromobacterium sp. Beijing]UJB32776.1 hypothetical protein HQN78_17985 [Chromobacterium sp. Beijing]